MQLIVKAKKLNLRKFIPPFFPHPEGIIGVVKENFIFEGEEVKAVLNPNLGKWYKDRDNTFYWGGGLKELEQNINEHAADFAFPDNDLLENIVITPVTKRKIEQVINAFETGRAEGNYATLVKLRDYNDPETNTRITQITFGRSQTTEFSHLKELVQDYIESNGKNANGLKPFFNLIGKKPSLASNDAFCNALIDAGKNDPIMKICQDRLFEAKYYQPAFNWFSLNGFTLPISLLVIYDSTIHSGGILSFLRKRFPTTVPSVGGNEKEWITNYVNVRHQWLENHSDPLLRKTVYRTKCLKEQVEHNNWDLSQKVDAHGVTIG